MKQYISQEWTSYVYVCYYFLLLSKGNESGYALHTKLTSQLSLMCLPLGSSCCRLVTGECYMMLFLVFGAIVQLWWRLILPSEVPFLGNILSNWHRELLSLACLHVPHHGAIRFGIFILDLLPYTINYMGFSNTFLIRCIIYTGFMRVLVLSRLKLVVQSKLVYCLST